MCVNVYVIMDKFEDIALIVENAACSEIGISYDDMRSRTKKGACVKARHLSIFILHTIYKVPLSWLSYRYNFSVRHILKAVAQIKDYIKYSKHYAELLNNIISVMPQNEA